MAPTASESKTRWAPQARRKACMGWSWAAARGVQGQGHIVAYSLLTFGTHIIITFYFLP